MPGDYSANPDSVEKGPAWWKEAIIYQIYPHSFCDSNGDGVGDIPGIISKLDHLKRLGVDVVWLSPIYASPMKDMGYDISDYRAINPQYGTMEDFDNLLKGMHERGIKLMMDLVVNHSSDQHAWFKESRLSKASPKRDWYIWRPARYDELGNRMPPNNWMSSFRGASAWSWDEDTQEYYLHIFTHEQPDLNWENPAVREQVYEDMRFWLNKGVDGFRMDVINMISKREGLPDAPITEEGRFLQPSWGTFTNGPQVHEYLKEMNRKVLSKYDLITVGEAPFTHCIDTLVKYVKPEEKELQMIFTFELHDVDGTPRASLKPRKFHLREFKRIIQKYQVDMLEAGGWNSVYLENHDQARSVNRFGSVKGELRQISAKLLALFHLTLSGTSYIYQGEEIAMANPAKPWTIGEYLDIKTRLYYYEVLNARKAQGDEEPDMTDVLNDLHQKARDNARLPMQWDASANAGFTTGKPWMRVNDDYREWNAAAQLQDEDSVFNFWQKMIKLRKSAPACVYGHFQQLCPDDPHMFAYRKVHPKQRLLVLLNFSTDATRYELPVELGDVGKYSVMMGNYAKPGVLGRDRAVGMRPFEAVVYNEMTLPN